MSNIKIRLRGDKTLDEVCAKGAPVHLEKMDSGCWFLSVGEVQIWLNSSRAITAYYEDNRKDHPRPSLADEGEKV